MMRHTSPGTVEEQAPRRDRETGGTATSSIVQISNNLGSSSSSLSSNRTAQLRNNYFSTGATRSSVHPIPANTTTTTARTGPSHGYLPLIPTTVSTSTSNLSIGYGPWPPTTTNRDGAPNPRPNPAHPTPPSHAGTTRRASRCDPARPVTTPGRNHPPAEAMDCPPSVAPGSISCIAAPTRPASGTLRGPLAHTKTPTGTGRSPGLGPSQRDAQAKTHSPRHPLPPGRGPRPDGTPNRSTHAPGVRSSRKQAHPQRLCLPYTQQQGRRRKRARQPPADKGQPLTWLGAGCLLRPSGPTAGDITQHATPHGAEHGPGDPPHLHASYGHGTGPPTRPVPRTRLQGLPHDSATQDLRPHTIQRRRSPTWTGDL